MIHKRIGLLCLTVLLALTGCQSAGVYNQSEANVADVVQKVEDARMKSNNEAKPTSPLLMSQGPYVDKTPINLAREPSWLKNKIVLRGDQLPFSYYSHTIVSDPHRNILTHYQVGLDDKATVAINYSGTVKGALDLLASKSGYVYTVNGNNIYWQAYITKTYEIAFVPGASDFTMGKASQSGGTGGSGSTNGSGSTVTAMINDSAAAEFSNLKGTLSVWKDLENSVKDLLSPDGRVMVSEATTTMTVRDHPSNVSLVTKFIANLNNNLSRQVLVKIQVLQIQLISSWSYGINWAAVQSAFGHSSYTLLGNYGTPIGITASNISSFGLGAVTSAASGNFDTTGAAGSTGVQVLINALKSQGKVSLVTEPRVVCLNNQVSVINIVDQQGYIASIQTTTLAGSTSSGGQITSQITPGNLVTGFTLYVLPKILNNKVYLQVNVDLSNEISLKTATSGTNSIQIPHVQQKQFNQKSMIASGDTMILSGFRQITNTANAQQLFDSTALGGRSAEQTNTETIVLITPIILHGPA